MARETKKRKEGTQPKRKDQDKTRQGGEGQRQETGGEKAKDEPASVEEMGC